jgi:hypothetical protein
MFHQVPSSKSIVVNKMSLMTIHVEMFSYLYYFFLIRVTQECFKVPNFNFRYHKEKEKKSCPTSYPGAVISLLIDGYSKYNITAPLFYIYFPSTIFPAPVYIRVGISGAFKSFLRFVTDEYPAVKS